LLAPAQWAPGIGDVGRIADVEIGDELARKAQPARLQRP
jgi:hypothetical protein